MDRNEGEAPLSNKGCDVQWRDTLYNQCGNLSVKLLSRCPTKWMSLGCPWK